MAFGKKSQRTERKRKHRQRGREMPKEYDVQQVCENGHQITDCYEINPEKRRKFCEECGAATMTACPNCDSKIQGAQIGVSQSWVEARTGAHTIHREIPADVPRYCQHCGKAFPWTQTKIQTAIQILAEFGELNDQEKETIERDVENIAKDVPEAELSARRIKRILKKCGNAGYEVLMELASRTAAKILKNP